MKLIHKGGFRERANRDRKYQQSENQKTTLEIKRAYRPRPMHNQVEETVELEPTNAAIAPHTNQQR